MLPAVGTLAKVTTLRDAYPEATTAQDKVSSRSGHTSPWVPMCAYIVPSFHTRHALSRRTPCVQNGKFPFDLALSSGCSASILALLQPGSAAWLCVNDGDLEGETKLSLPLPLVSAEEIKVFASLSHLLDPNPRRVKRIINVYALVTEVAKRVPLSEGGSKARSALS